MIAISEPIKKRFIGDVGFENARVLQTLLSYLPISHEHHNYHTNEGILISVKPTIKDGIVGDKITGVITIFSVTKYDFVIRVSNQPIDKPYKLVKWSEKNIIRYYSKYITKFIFDE